MEANHARTGGTKRARPLAGRVGGVFRLVGGGGRVLLLLLLRLVGSSSDLASDAFAEAARATRARRGREGGAAARAERRAGRRARRPRTRDGTRRRRPPTYSRSKGRSRAARRGRRGRGRGVARRVPARAASVLARLLRSSGGLAERVRRCPSPPEARRTRGFPRLVATGTPAAGTPAASASAGTTRVSTLQPNGWQSAEEPAFPPRAPSSGPRCAHPRRAIRTRARAHLRPGTSVSSRDAPAFPTPAHVRRHRRVAPPRAFREC